jgi:hypothetical protein
VQIRRSGDMSPSASWCRIEQGEGKESAFAVHR